MAIGFLALATAAALVQPSPGQVALLTPQNQARAEVRVDPLVWDGKLAADAALWARHLADTGLFEHARQEDEGENLWMGTRGRYSAEEMVGGWIEEQRFYRPGIFPDVAKTGRWWDVGHYTQLIWQGTRKVGCAVASSAENDVLVCRYSPPGNVMGESPASLTTQPIRN